MEVVRVPKRKFRFDIDGKIYEAKELSMAYLENSAINPEEDNADTAILDSIGEITQDDLKLFSIETKNILYTEIIRFTFQETLTEEEVSEISKEFGITPIELMALDRGAKEQLRNILNLRKTPEEDSEKKKSLKSDLSKTLSKLIRSGHSRVFEYGYSFYLTAYKELLEAESDAMVNTAYMTRVAHVSPENWKKFVDENKKPEDKKPKEQKKKKMTKDDHLAVIRRLKNIG